jgi:hypothetical protein
MAHVEKARRAGKHHPRPLATQVPGDRIFTSYENILEHCCQAWNKLTDQPWRIMSIGMREWANGF